MQKRTTPKSIARLLSERSRGAEPDGGAASDILGHLKDVFEQVVQAAGSAQQEDGGGIAFTLGGKQGRMVFGYNMRMGLDGLKAEPFGDIPAPAPKPGAGAQAAARAPIVDIFEEAGSIRIVAELPGVGAEDIGCTLTGDTLHIETRQAPIYRKTVHLPAAVDPASLVQSCRNGILEIRLNRASG